MTSSTDTDSFSYENDIMPMQKKYFESTASKVSDPMVRTALLADNRNIIEGEFIKRAKMEELGMMNRGRELSYQSALVSLDQSRTDAANKRDMIKTMVPFQNRLDSILKDPSIDSVERKRQVGIVAVENAGLLAVNDAASKAFEAAKIGIGDTENKKLTVFDYVRAGGDTKYLSEVSANPADLDLNTELNPAWFLDKTNKSALNKQRQKDDLDIEQKKQEQSNTMSNGLLTSLTGVKLKASDALTQTDEFDTAGHAFVVANVVSTFGTPEEKASFAKTKSAKAQLDLAVAAGVRQTQKTLAIGGSVPAGPPSPRSLFAKKKPEEVPLPPLATH